MATGWLRTATSALICCILLGCSNVAASPTVLASDTLSWGARLDQSVDWEVQQLVGDKYSLHFVTETNGSRSRRSVRRESPDDLVWLVATVPIPDAPTMAFGGVAEEIDSVVLLTAQGDEIQLEIVPVQDREWGLVVGQLPSRWATAGVFSVEIVVSSGGAEVGRENFQGVG